MSSIDRPAAMTRPDKETTMTSAPWFQHELPSESERELLVILAEECAEVAQRVSKLLRFGADEIQPDQPDTNAARLGFEVGDLQVMVDLAKAVGIITDAAMNAGRVRKNLQLAKYMRYPLAAALTPRAEGEDAPVVALPSAERNARVQARYDELYIAGKHGHYETMFRVVNEEIARAARAPSNESAEERQTKIRAWFQRGLDKVRATVGPTAVARVDIADVLLGLNRGDHLNEERSPYAMNATPPPEERSR